MPQWAGATTVSLHDVAGNSKLVEIPVIVLFEGSIGNISDKTDRNGTRQEVSSTL